MKNLTIFKITKRGWSRPLPLLIINMFFWLNKILHGLKMASETLQTIKNGWAPEIKRLNDNLEKLEASLTGTDECVLDIYSLEETLQDKITILDAELTTVKTDVANLKDHLDSVFRELNGITGGANEKNLIFQEAEIFALKAENIEMRKQLNELAAIVNQKHGYEIIEKPDERIKIDQGTTPPPGYNLRSHVINID